MYPSWQWNSLLPWANRRIRIIREIANCPYKVTQHHFHCVPQQPPRGFISMCHTRSIDLVEILLAKNVLIHLSYVPFLPGVCTYQPHPQQIAQADLLFSNRSAIYGFTHRWLSGGSCLWFWRVLPLSNCLLWHVYVCCNEACSQCKCYNIRSHHHENNFMFWLLPHMHPWQGR